MPSRDPVTGRRLSGAGQKALKAARAGGAAAPVKKRPARPAGPPPADPPPGFAELPPPPLADGVIAVSEWAGARVLPLCVQLADEAQDLTRVRVVQALCGRLGKMRDKSLRAEQACAIRLDRLGTVADVLALAPPLGDPIGVLVWSFLRLARAVHQAAQDVNFSRDRWLTIGDACATMGMLPPNAAIEAFLDEVDPQAEG